MDTTFTGFLARRDTVTKEAHIYFGFAEITDLFPRREINQLFYERLRKLLDRPGLPSESKQELMSLLDLDFVAYIDRSLRRAGFANPDLDHLVHDLVVKMVVTGNLFDGWVRGSFKARFLVSLRNAISTLVTKKAKTRKRSHDLPDDVAISGQTDSGVIDHFRTYLRTTLGETAVSVFDHRLAGEDIKELIGQDLTSYRLKKIAAEIKDAARRFASGDDDFSNRVQRAFDKEGRTMEKRFRKSDA